MNLETINLILEKVERIRPIPSLSLRVLKAAGNSDASLSQIVDIVRLDDVLTLKILKLVNSPLFSKSGGEIKSVDEALRRIGLQSLIRIILSGSNGLPFDNAGEGYALTRGDLWRHSIGCAAVSQHLAVCTGFEELNTLYTACVLHDIGKTVLDVFIGEKRSEIFKSLKSREKVFTKIEMEILGLDHAAVGGKILDAWSIPADIANAVRWHHDPEKAAESSELAWHVHISDLICLMVGVGLGIDGLTYECRTERFSKYNLKESDLQKLLIKAVEELEKAGKWLEGE